MERIRQWTSTLALVAIGTALLIGALRPAPSQATESPTSFTECTVVLGQTAFPNLNLKKFRAGDVGEKDLIPTNGWTPIGMHGVANGILFCR